MARARVLLVDDDEVVLSTMGALLEAQGFDVVSHSNVPEALRTIVSEPFDVLLSDLHMPEPGDGLTLVSAMHHVHPRALKLIQSAHPDVEVAAQTIAAQVNGVLAKSADISSLVAMIRTSLATPSNLERATK